jgi:flagellar biosynthetic protein FliR
MNIFILGLPVKIALGFFVLAIALPLAVEILFPHVEQWVEFALQSATVWR